MTTTTKTLYDTDTHAWSQEQVALLQGGEYDLVDWDNIIEEIDSLGKSAQNEAESRLILIIQHLLKWQYQPEKRTRSWFVTIGTQRNALDRHLRDNPSLRAHRADFVAESYRYAVKQAILETDLPRTTFPATCPWDIDQILDDEFFPDAADALK